MGIYCIGKDWELIKSAWWHFSNLRLWCPPWTRWFRWPFRSAGPDRPRGPCWRFRARSPRRWSWRGCHWCVVRFWRHSPSVHQPPVVWKRFLQQSKYIYHLSGTFIIQQSSLPQKILICRSLHNSVAVQQIIISNIPFSLFWVQGKVGFFSKQEKLCISKSREDLIHISAEISHHEHLVFHFFSYFHDVMVPVWSRNIHVIVS